MDLDFANLRFTVPDGWKNDSTLVFTMPPAELGGGMMVTKKASSRPSASLSITWQDAVGSQTPTEYLAQREEGFARALPAYQALSRGAVEGVEGGAFLEHRFDPGGVVLVQVLLVRRVGARMIVVTGTALESELSRVRDRFIETFRSLTAA